MVVKEGNNSTKGFNRDPMPDHEYLTIGRVAEILDRLEWLGEAYASSSTDRHLVSELIGMVLLGLSMEFRLRKYEQFRNADTQDTQSPNP